jgi:hypothetical protein
MNILLIWKAVKNGRNWEKITTIGSWYSRIGFLFILLNDSQAYKLDYEQS